MRVYCLQIHTNTESDEMDNIHICESIEALTKVFDDSCNYHKKCSECCLYWCPPEEDDVNGVCGGFEFENADGSITRGRVFDYDVV